MKIRVNLKLQMAHKVISQLATGKSFKTKKSSKIRSLQSITMTSLKNAMTKLMHHTTRIKSKPKLTRTKSCLVRKIRQTKRKPFSHLRTGKTTTTSTPLSQSPTNQFEPFSGWCSGR